MLDVAGGLSTLLPCERHLLPVAVSKKIADQLEVPGWNWNVEALRAN